MRVLIADGDDAERQRIEAALFVFGYRFESAESVGRARDAARRQAPDVALVAADLPGGDPLALCAGLREAAGERALYVVLLGERVAGDAVRRALAAGIDDLLARPLDEDELHLRLQVAERMNLQQAAVAAARAEVERLKGELRSLARTDPLTGFGNRLQLTDDLDLLQGQLDRYGHRYAAAIVDVDNFRSFNERHGQLAGDEALRVVAQVIGGQLRTGDRAYRYGGDAFVVLLPQQGLRSARVAIDRILRAIVARAMPHEGNPPSGVLTASAGIAVFAEGRAGRYDDLLARADAVLEQAKAGGANRVGSAEVGGRAG